MKQKRTCSSRNLRCKEIELRDGLECGKKGWCGDKSCNIHSLTHSFIHSFDNHLLGFYPMQALNYSPSPSPREFRESRLQGELRN